MQRIYKCQRNFEKEEKLENLNCPISKLTIQLAIIRKSIYTLALTTVVQKWVFGNKSLYLQLINFQQSCQGS